MRVPRSAFVTTGLLLLACLGLAAPARAGEGGDEDAIRAQVRRLAQKAAHMRELGKEDDARELMQRAEELERKLGELQRMRAASEERQKRAARSEKAGKDAPAAVRRLAEAERGLRGGIEALEMLGGQRELVERLASVLDDVRRKRAALEARDGPQAHAREREAPAPDPSPEALARRLDVIRLALAALREGEKRDAVELLERALHAGELLLAGRRDEEAQAAFRRMPPRPALVELLRLAARLWDEFGHERKAHAVAELAAYYAAQIPTAEDEARERDREGEGEGPARPAETELRRLRAQVESLQQALERLRAEVRGLAGRLK